MASILLVYASTGGNTEMTAEFVAQLLTESGHKVALQRAEKSQSKDLLDFDVVLLASPTYGHGILEEHMTRFVKGFKGIDLKGKPVAVIGLGDPKYESQYHLESAPILEQALEDAGGKILLPALRISRTPVMHLKGLITNWGKQLIAKL